MTDTKETQGPDGDDFLEAEYRHLVTEMEYLVKFRDEVRVQVDRMAGSVNHPGMAQAIAPFLQAMAQLIASANTNISTRITLRRLREDIRRKIEGDSDAETRASVLVDMLAARLSGTGRITAAPREPSGSQSLVDSPSLEDALRVAHRNSKIQLSTEESATLLGGTIRPERPKRERTVATTLGEIVIVDADTGMVSAPGPPGAGTVQRWAHTSEGWTGEGMDGRWYPIFEPTS